MQTYTKVLTHDRTFPSEGRHVPFTRAWIQYKLCSSEGALDVNFYDWLLSSFWPRFELKLFLNYVHVSFKPFKSESHPPIQVKDFVVAAV